METTPTRVHRPRLTHGGELHRFGSLQPHSPSTPSTPPGSSRLLRRTASQSVIVNRPRAGSIIGLHRASSSIWENTRPETKEQKLVRELLEQLERKDADARVAALQTLGRMVSQPSMAPLVVKHCSAVVRCLEDSEVSVRSAALRSLRCMAEHGESGAVALHCRAIIACLKDEEVVLRSKTAALCRVLAEEGGATLLAHHVPDLLACFERSSLVTPLDALRAIVDAGEVRVVSHGISKIVGALESPSVTVRVAACDALAAIGREGGGELLRRLRFIELADSMAGNEESRPLLEALTSLVHAEAERTTRLAAARALQSIAEADEESARILRSKHSYRLVQVMCWSSTRRDNALTDALAAILGSKEEGPDADEAGESDSDAEGGEEDCVICQRSLERHGERRTLPCHHVFHKHCLNQWFMWSRKCWGMETCPLCRRQGHVTRKAAH